jgi:hypothetical protein
MHLKCIGYNLKVSFCCVYIIVHVPAVFHTRCVDKFVWYLCTKFHISNACSSLVIITLKMKITVSAWSLSYFMLWKHYLTKSCVMFQDLVLPYISSSSKASGCSSAPVSQVYVTVNIECRKLKCHVEWCSYQVEQKLVSWSFGGIEVQTWWCHKPTLFSHTFSRRKVD